MAQARGLNASLHTVCVPDAMAAARSGNIDLHNRMLAQAAPQLVGCDAVMLAHFSTSTALESVSSELACPVLSAPRAAVAALRALIT